MCVEAHCHTRQHSERDEANGRSSAQKNSTHKTTKAENLCGRTQDLDLRRTAQKAS